ncbi:MAG TPA: redoxin family protein [Acidobacteriaceae bacterium]|jgi:thiol-disulfide isomerase/thioredoxin
MFLLAGGARILAQASDAAPAYAVDPKFKAALAEGQKLDRRHEFRFAADSYKKANKIAQGQCFACLRALYGAQLGDASYKDAANTAIELGKIADAPLRKSNALYLQAEAVYLGAGEKPKQEKLEATEGLLKEALGLAPQNAAALFLQGKVLTQLGKLDEAKMSYAECVKCVDPRDPSRLRAQHFAEDPSLALHKMAPAFEVTALDGSKFNLDAMGGRVVLIDFWATWCGPCNEELPHLRKIAAEFAGQPLVVISVSWDADETKWKDFIARNNMTWVQYRDADHKLSDNFGVQAIPHYFTIDSDGVLTAEMLGSGSDVEGKLKKLLARARDSQKQTASLPAAEHQPGN